MRYVVISTDFSVPANNAMYYGVNMAKELGASVVLFHAYQLALTTTEATVVMSQASINNLKKEAEDRLYEIKDKIESDSLWTVKVFVEVRMGNTADQLESFCEDIKPFAVVMGSKSHSAFHRILFGSTTLAAIRHLNCPVIAVPPGKEYKSIKKIGFASDFNEVMTTTPVSFIKEMTQIFDAELHVLNVDLHNRSRAPEKNEQLSHMQGLLKDMNPKFHFIEHASIEEGINEFVDQSGLDLLIAIPKKHNILDSIFQKSSSRQIVFESHVPVMCIHEL